MSYTNKVFFTMGLRRSNTVWGYRYALSTFDSLIHVNRPKNIKKHFVHQQDFGRIFKRGFDNYVDRTRKQFDIKETDAECGEALNLGIFLLYHSGNALMSKENPFTAVFIDREKAEELLKMPIIDAQSAFLRISEDSNKSIFALSLPKDLDTQSLTSIEDALHGKFTNLRLAMLSGKGQCSILSHGYSLLKWLHITKFCSKCGSPAEKNTSGSRVTCSNEKCGLVFYPPTSPVGIVLVTSLAHSHVLLVRQPKYPVGMYSCVAGFVDMGETLYDCVKREVAEEAGIEILPHSISSFKVLASQHWPFPNGSLMTGCLATAYGPRELGAEAPKIDSHGEIENARWFEVVEIIEAMTRINKNPMLRMKEADNTFKASDVFVPPQGAIAHQLLKIWLKEYHDIVV